ncbi:sugar transferase [Halobacteriovorax sp. ZH1_bin.1]|uniref:sugar transferase n=1 Tax=Halobacteriovorax sp. ZH1_bin.1 TaxID=3157723 RepID=UPI0037244569
MYINFKSIIDFICGVILFLIFLPILTVVAIGVKLSSPGPIFFKQVRVGKNGKTFNMFKFRSMVVNNSSEFTTANDPRITKFGKFIRKTSLDELPQILNILNGDMSFIGPRPAVPSQVNDYGEYYFTLRHKVKPGITGLHQATIRSGGTMRMKAILDAFYARNISLGLDLIIVIRTFKILFNSKASN